MALVKRETTSISIPNNSELRIIRLLKNPYNPYYTYLLIMGVTPPR